MTNTKCINKNNWFNIIILDFSISLYGSNFRYMVLVIKNRLQDVIKEPIILDQKIYLQKHLLRSLGNESKN